MENASAVNTVCTGPNCSDRRLDKFCDKGYCSPCCKATGGCGLSLHRSATSNIAGSQSTAVLAGPWIPSAADVEAAEMSLHSTGSSDEEEEEEEEEEEDEDMEGDADEDEEEEDDEDEDEDDGDDSDTSSLGPMPKFIPERNMLGSDLRSEYYARRERKEWYYKRYQRRRRELDKIRAAKRRQFTLIVWDTAGQMIQYQTSMSSVKGFTLLEHPEMHSALGYKEGIDDPKAVKWNKHNRRTKKWETIDITTYISNDRDMIYLLTPVNLSPDVKCKNLTKAIRIQDDAWLKWPQDDDDSDAESSTWIGNQRVKDGLSYYTEEENYYGVDANW